MNANSDLEKSFDAAPAMDANHQPDFQGTQQKGTEQSQSSEGEQIDYKKKFSESSAEALRLFEENKRLREAQEARDREQAIESTTDDNLYPGFEELDPEAAQNLVNYTNHLRQEVAREIYKDPAIAYSRELHNEKKWDDAFQTISSKFPELKDTASEFKQKYFQRDKSPSNLEELMEGMAKMHLFDKAKDIGAMEEKSRANRIDTERAHGGDKTPKSNRTLDEWEHMAKTDPVGFAAKSKEYQADLESGKLKE